MREYNNKDYELLQSFYRSHGLIAPPRHSLPHYGLITECVAGFLYLTNSSVALIDGVVSNKQASKEQKQSDLKALSEALINKAQQLGCWRVVCFTNISSIKALTEVFGAKASGNTQLFYKEL